MKHTLQKKEKNPVIVCLHRRVNLLPLSPREFYENHFFPVTRSVKGRPLYKLFHMRWSVPGALP